MKPEKKTVTLAMSILILTAILAVLLQESAITGNIIRNGSLYYYLDNPEKAMEEYNKNIEHVPGFVKSIFGHERINLEVGLENSSKREFGVVTEKGIVISVEKEYLEDATLKVKINDTVINKIIQAEDQVKELQDALDKKEIEYKAVRLKTKAKTFLARVALKISSWFR